MNKKYKWDSQCIEAVVSTDGTVFIKGPYHIDNKQFDYKMINEHGNTFCSINEIISWGYMIDKVIEL